MIAERTKFKRDSHKRARYFHPDSFKHSGKANLNLLSALLQHMPAGQLVIDPMGGTGSILIATDYQHPVISGELERHWAHLSELNRKSIAGHTLFSNSTPALVCQWDAGRLPLAAGSIPGIITSPPYWDMLSDWHIRSKGLQATHETYGPAYGVDPKNLGNIHIYEDYLRAMALVYHECWRVLGPGRKLVLVLKDRVHKFKRVPIVRDTIGLVTALGFRLVGQIDRECNPSLHRRVNENHNPQAEKVDTEQALIFEKLHPEFTEGGNPLRIPAKFALVQTPKPQSAPSWQLYVKQWNYATSRADIVLLMSQYGLQENFDWGPRHSKFSRRKEFAFKCAAELVTKWGLAAGDEIEIHASMAYGQYLRERLTTFGGRVIVPTEGLNLGQKLQWYTNPTPSPSPQRGGVGEGSQERQS